VAETCDIINKNNNNLHCDGVVYNTLEETEVFSEVFGFYLSHDMGERLKF
jgi:hypothetical protein